MGSRVGKDGEDPNVGTIRDAEAERATVKTMGHPVSGAEGTRASTLSRQSWASMKSPPHRC